MSHLARSLFDLHQKMNLRQIFHLLTSTTTVVCRECRHPLLHGRDVNFVYRISGRGRTVLGLMGKADITGAPPNHTHRNSAFPLSCSLA